jgi:uncharacterized protein (TIGR02246 family)
MPSIEQIRNAVEGYVDSFNTHDRDRFLALFTDDVTQVDPVGSAPNVGRNALAGFWDAVHADVEGIDFRVDDLIVSGDEAALVFTIVQSKKDMKVTLRGVDTFRVDDSGRIAQVKGYCDNDHITNDR